VALSFKYCLHPLAYLASKLLVAQTNVVDIVLSADANGTNLALNDIAMWLWLGTTQHYTSPVWYDRPIDLIPGYQLFGLMEVIEWKRIIPSFFEALGFAPVGTPTNKYICSLCLTSAYRPIVLYI
jgi:hypothetical protein